MTESDPEGRLEWIRESLDAYEGPLLRYATRILGDLESARDIVQDVFLRLCSADRASLDGRLGPWLFAVCRNRALDVCRKENRMSPLTQEEIEVRPTEEPNPRQNLERAQTARSALKFLAELPARQQEVVRLKFQEGMSYREIGRVTGNSVSNVGFLLHRALKTLRGRLQGSASEA